MITFIRKNLEGFLIAATIILVGVMASCFVWGIVYVSQNLNAALQFKPAVPQATNFNITGAQKLNLHGLVQ